MAQESYKKLGEEVKSSAPKKCRCSTTYVQIACLISLVVILIVCVVSIERRLAFLEKRIDSMMEEETDRDSQDRRPRSSTSHKRTVCDSLNRLSSLTKQLRSLQYSCGIACNLAFTAWETPASNGEKRHNTQELTSGVVYHRWGRSNCSGDATLVYHGYMANGHNTNLGSGSTYICLPSSVKYGSHSDPSDPREGTTIYGSRYHTSFRGFKNNLNEHLALCAMCYVESRGSQIMVPATNVCPTGWTVEYRGYLMSAHRQDHNPSQFVCVDEEAEAGGAAFADGAALYVVQGRLCGRLPCKLFVNGYQLTCVVCTK